MAAKDIFQWQQKISFDGSKRYLPLAAKDIFHWQQKNMVLFCLGGFRE